LLQGSYKEGVFGAKEEEEENHWCEASKLITDKKYEHVQTEGATFFVISCIQQ
jgi:hypothetical protein